jgi:membrane fusion protein (multidrug efflux system)
MESTQATSPVGVGGAGNGAAVAPPADLPAERERSSQIRRAVLIVAIAVAAIVALVAGVRYISYATTHETTDDAKIDADQVQVTSKITERVDRVLVDTNQYVRKNQLLLLLDDRDERTRYENALAARNAYAQEARAADATVALTRDQQNAQNRQNAGAIDQARASVQSASEQARSAEQQVGVAGSGIAGAAAQVRAAEAAVPGALQNLRKAQADLQRTSSLVSSGDVARQQLDAANAAEKAAQSANQQAVDNVSVARANLAAAQRKYAAQQATTGSAEALIAASEGALVTAEGKLAESSTPERVVAQQANADAVRAQVATANTQVRTARDNLSYTRIRSPIDGYVGQKAVDTGQTVSPSLALLTIVPTNVYVTANYKETQTGRIHPGQPVDINVDAYKGVKFHGVVENISPASQNSFSLIPAQNASGNFVKVTQRVPVRIRFVDPDPKYPLRVGMSIETSVKVK